jgi:hypothetical protein
MCLLNQKSMQQGSRFYIYSQNPWLLIFIAPNEIQVWSWMIGLLCLVLPLPIHWQNDAVSTAIRHGLDVPGFQQRWGVRNSLFSTPFQTDPGAHPASRTMGTGSLSRGISCRGVALTSYPLLVPGLRMSKAVPPTSVSAWWWDLYLYPFTMMHLTYAWHFYLQQRRHESQTQCCRVPNKLIVSRFVKAFCTWFWALKP